jgi:hypothetical protein
MRFCGWRLATIQPTIPKPGTSTIEPPSPALT